MDMLEKVKELKQDDVVISDLESLQSKLCSLVNDGPEKLQILADFDATLTKRFVDGKAAVHSLGVFEMTKGLSEAYLTGCSRMMSKFMSQLSQCEGTFEEKQQILWQWWDEHEALVRGEQITVEDIHRATDAANTPLRDGTELMFHLLKSHQVPMTVISAGFGEVVERSLEKFKPDIVSNFLQFDSSGRISGYIKPTVSVYNKHELYLPMNNDRHNVIVLGDSLGDSLMPDGVADKKTVIKFGFLNEDEKKLQLYCQHFDVVLLNDQSMDVVNAVLKLVLEPK